MNEDLEASERLDQMAEEAVRRLRLGTAIEDYADDVHQRLLEADNQAENAPVNADMMFVALSLPMVNGLIHFASTRPRLNDAIQWVRTVWAKDSEEQDVDPLSTLSALTLIYIVNHASKTRESSFPTEVKTWGRIRRRVHRLKKDMEDKDGDTPGDGDSPEPPRPQGSTPPPVS